MKLACKELNAHLDKRLKWHKNMMPIRVHQLLDDLNPLLRQHKQIDVFDLLVELILLANKDPAQELCALMTALDGDALIELEQFDIMNAASLIRDTLKQDTARWHLQEYHDRKKEKKKQKN